MLQLRLQKAYHEIKFENIIFMWNPQMLSIETKKMNTRIIEKVLLTSTALRSPLREDCNSFSSFSSFLLELDIPIISNAMNLYRHPSISTIRDIVCVITTQIFPPPLLPLKSCGRFEYPGPSRAYSSPSQRKNHWTWTCWKASIWRLGLLVFGGELFSRRFCKLERWHLENKVVELAK